MHHDFKFHKYLHMHSSTTMSIWSLIVDISLFRSPLEHPPVFVITLMLSVQNIKIYKYCQYMCTHTLKLYPQKRYLHTYIHTYVPSTCSVIIHINLSFQNAYMSSLVLLFNIRLFTYLSFSHLYNQHDLFSKIVSSSTTLTKPVCVQA